MHPDFAINDRIVRRGRPAWRDRVMTVTGYDAVRHMVHWTMPNGDNPPITGFGPAEGFELEQPLLPSRWHAEKRGDTITIIGVPCGR